MATTLPHRCLQEVTNVAFVSPTTPSNKEARTAVKILTFAVDHSPVQVELLSTHTIHDLVDIICRETLIGHQESVYDHMWNIVHVTNGDKYREELVFDHIPPYEHKFANGESTPSGSGISSCKTDDAAAFPRRRAAPMPAGYVDFEPTIDTNALFPNLDEWAFQDPKAGALELNLFQPGRKQQHFGIWYRQHMDIVQMLYLPSKPGPDLSNYFACLETASKINFSAFYRSNWQSVVALPTDASADKIEKYGYAGQEPGFCDMVMYDGQSPTLMNDIFPNVATLVGCDKSKKKKKSEKVPRGWITYHDKTIRVCTESASKHISNAPKYTAWNGCEQFKPANEDYLLFQVNIEIKSVHQLLCVVEGLLRTL